MLFELNQAANTKSMAISKDAMQTTKWWHETTNRTSDDRNAMECQMLDIPEEEEESAESM